jgi:hypothetical protein
MECLPFVDYMKILLDFSARVGREDIFKPTIRNESLLDITNDNGIRVINCATSWTSDGKTCNHSYIVNVQFLEDLTVILIHYLIVAKDCQ